jgi:hypothetical protein
MSLFSKLFGGGTTPSAEPETYDGFTIKPTPQKECGGWRRGSKGMGKSIC